jgi:hypothetical protein
MILTDKAKEDFLIHLKKTRRCTEESFSEFPETFEDALIIDWLQYIDMWENIFYYEYRSNGFKDYKLCINKTIEKCNEIYNSPFKH